MTGSQIGKLASKFLKDRSGDFAMQSALMFAALAVVGALVAAPLLDNATRQHAANGAYGIDPFTTASTRATQGTTRTYTVRKSILDDRERIICRTAGGSRC
jgi:hypothetical protein